VGTYCYVAVCTLQARSARRREAPTEGGDGRGHIVAAARLQVVLHWIDSILLEAKLTRPRSDRRRPNAQGRSQWQNFGLEAL